MTAAFTAEDLLAFVMALSSAWTPASAVAPALDTSRLHSHRGAVVEAVRRLVSL